MANAQTTQNSNEYEQCGNPFIIPEDKTNRNLPLTINLYRTFLPTIHSNLRRQCRQYRTSIEGPNHSTKKNLEILITWLHEQYGRERFTPICVSTKNQKADYNTKPYRCIILQAKDLPLFRFENSPPADSEHHRLLELDK